MLSRSCPNCLRGVGLCASTSPLIPPSDISVVMVRNLDPILASMVQPPCRLGFRPLGAVDQDCLSRSFLFIVVLLVGSVRQLIVSSSEMTASLFFLLDVVRDCTLFIGPFNARAAFLDGRSLRVLDLLRLSISGDWLLGFNRTGEIICPICYGPNFRPEVTLWTRFSQRSNW